MLRYDFNANEESNHLGNVGWGQVGALHLCGLSPNCVQRPGLDEKATIDKIECESKQPGEDGTEGICGLWQQHNCG